MASLGSLVVNLGANTSNFTKGMTDAQKQLTKFSAGVVAAGVAVGALAAKKFIEFDDAMRATSAVTGAAGQRLDIMTAKAKELGATTSFTAVEVAGLMTELGRAGFDPESINAMTDSVLSLARASGTEASQAAAILSTTVRQFGLDASDAAHVADVLTHAANSTLNTVGDLGEAMKFAAPAATALGISLEETTAAVAMLGNIGVQGTMAGTAFRRLAALTASESKKMEEAFGFAWQTGAGEMRPLLDNLEDLGKSLNRMSGPDRMGKLKDAFGLLGITGAVALGTSAGSAKELEGELSELVNTAKEAAEMMDAGLGGATRRAMSAFEGLMIVAGEQLAPVLIAVADVAAGVLRVMGDFSSVLVPLAVGIVAVNVAALAYIAITKIWIPAQIKILALMGPKGWAMLAGAGVAIAGMTYALSDNGEQARATAAATEKNREAENKLKTAVDAGAKSQALSTAAQEARVRGAKELKSALQALESPTATIAREMEEFQRVMRDSGKDQTIDMAPLLQAMKKSKSGFTDMLTSTNNELKILKGTATETSLELEAMAKAGVDDKSIKHLQSVLAERDKLQKGKDATEAATKEAEKNAKLLVAKKKEMTAQAEAIIASVASPADKVKNEVERLKKLIAAGELDKSIAEKYMVKFQQDALGGVEKKQIAPSQQRGSTEAITTILTAMQGRKKSEEVQATETTNEILRGMAAVNARQEERKEKRTVQGAVA